MELHDELHNDDQPVGRVLTRREILSLFGGAGAALVIAGGLTRVALAQDATAEATAATSDALAVCVVRPAETEGPYFVDEMLNRSDIRIDPTDNRVVDGLPLYLTFHVSQTSAGACTRQEIGCAGFAWFASPDSAMQRHHGQHFSR